MMNIKTDTEVKEQWCSKVLNELDDYIKRNDEKIDKHQQQMKASKKKNELESKLAQEMKLNNELTERLTELSRRSTEIDRVCASLKNRLTIADNDKKRLENAKEIYELAKKLTGIRFDFTAPPNMAKGYIKNEHRKLLQPFEIDMSAGDASEALWAAVQATTAPDWTVLYDKENKPLK